MRDIKYHVYKELLAEGKTYQDIATLHGISRQAVFDYCKRNNLEKVWKEKSPTSLDLRVQQFGGDKEMYTLARQKYVRKRQNCLSNGEEFTVTFEEIEWPTVCPVLGIPLVYETEKWREEGSVSFDRVDSTHGYVTGNVKIISWRANRIKNDGTSDEHRKIAEYIDKHKNSDM